MVGAETIGELAWSIENMLNQLLEGVISSSDSLLSLVSRVTGVMPELLEDFRTQSNSSVNVAAFMECAELLAKGETAEVPDLGATADEQGEAAPVLETDEPVAEDVDLVDESVVEETGRRESG